MYACQMEKSKSGIICILKNIERGLRNPFSKSAQTTKKSANSTKRCSNDNLKSAQTTIFYKTLYFNRKSFCNILGAEWHLLPLEKTKIINSSLYEQKNHFSYPVSVADDGNFSCHCAAENRNDLHLPLRTEEGHVLRSLEWQ